MMRLRFICIIFQPIDFYWAKDKNNYFAFNHMRGVRKVLCDYSTFIFIGVGYGCDREKVYFNGAPVQDADPASFRIINSVLARDKYRRYVAGDVYWADKEKGQPNK